MRYLQIPDGYCVACNNKCQECEVNTTCDFPWVSAIWKKNSKLLTPLMPGWVKPEFKNKHIVSVSGKYDWCIFNVPKKSDTITIQDICVDEEGRGQGLSKKIINGLMEEYDRDIIAKCIKGSSADSFWSHIGTKLYEEPSKQTTLCVYRVKNTNKKIDKQDLW